MKHTVVAKEFSMTNFVANIRILYTCTSYSNINLKMKLDIIVDVQRLDSYVNNTAINSERKNKAATYRCFVDETYDKRLLKFTMKAETFTYFRIPVCVTRR